MPSTPVITIDATGIHAPEYATVLAYFEAAYRAIYGDDVYLKEDSQDGQFLALIALAVHECNSAGVAVYNAFSPATAQGVGLSSVVKVNGIRRAVPTYSQADLRIIGQAGTIIEGGMARDAASSAWVLPPLVEIPLSGEITVTATAATLGAVQAPANTITIVATPTRGWQSVTNPMPATPGLPVESDPALKDRQTRSTALPAQSILEGLLGSVSALPGVARVRGVENDTSGVEPATGIPGHTIALVVDGGDIDEIASVIARKKPPGVGTYGDVLRTVVDAYGIPHPMRFLRPAVVPVAYYLTVRAFPGYTVDVEIKIKQALAAWTNALGIGMPLRLTRAYLPANLYGAAASAAYEVLTMVAQRDGFAPGDAVDIEPRFSEVLVCEPADVSVRVVTA